MKLEIGGGTNRREGYLNFDINPDHADSIQVGAATLPLVGELGAHGQFNGHIIPVEDATVERVFASHVMEHIPIVGGNRIRAMNEIHRVLVPGGEFEIIVPCIGYTDHPNGGAPVAAGWQGWADPTHSSQWWFPESFWYFTGGPAGNFRACADYGILYWNEQSSEIRDGWEAHVVLTKPQESAA